MSIQINQSYLERKVQYLNKQHNLDLSINFAACYGGYCIEDDNRRFRHSIRMTNQQMNAFLDGINACYELERLKEYKAKCDAFVKGDS